MSENDTAKCFTLKGDQRGIVELPYCKLVICCQRESDEPTEQDVFLTLLDSDRPSNAVPAEVQEELVAALGQIPGMGEKKVRDDLLRYLKPEEKDAVKPRSEDKLEDLRCIVKEMEETGKLDHFISAARELPMDSELNDKLGKIYEQVVSQKIHGLPKGGTVSPGTPRDLFAILMDHPLIRDKETRDALLEGLSGDLLESLEPRPSGTKPDLLKTLERVKSWPEMQDGTRQIDIFGANAVRLMEEGTKLKSELLEFRRKESEKRKGQ